MDKVFKIFVDFDRTITKLDVGDLIFREFADKDLIDEIIQRQLRNEISAKDSWKLQCEAAGIVDKQRLNEFIDSVEINKTFHDLVNYCDTNRIELFILSDGFDYYIDRILKKENLNRIKVYSNKLTFTDEGKIIPVFPYLDLECTSSANCKRNHIINHSGDDDFTVFIGDGNSDKYTAQFCDFIFAKDDLLKFCERERITFFPYRDFSDVVAKLEQLKSKKRLKKRHQAELKRKEIYTIE